MIYQFKSGRHFRGLLAQIAGEELERIRLSHGGRLATSAVLDDARKATSPLHPVFTWDDAVAAEAHRLWEARQLIRSVVVVDEVTDRTVPAYWTVSVGYDVQGGSEHYYQAVAEIANNQAEYASALNAMLGRLKAAQTAIDQLRAIVPANHSVKVEKAAKQLRVAERTLQSMAA